MPDPVRLYILSDPSNLHGWHSPVRTCRFPPFGLDAAIQEAHDAGSLPAGTHLVAILWSDGDIALERVTVEQAAAPTKVTLTSRVREGVAR